MHIDDLRVCVVPTATAEEVWVRLRSVDGCTGYGSFSTTGGLSGQALAATIHAVCAPILLGADALQREHLWQTLLEVQHQHALPPLIHGCLDVALWDLAGKALKQPIYRLLGATRQQVRASAHAAMLADSEAHVRLARACQEHGYRAYVLRAWGEPARDVAACRAVRQAVGEKLELMLDVGGAYDVAAALWVGRQLEALHFTWFGTPLPDALLPAYRRLTHELHIAVAAAGSTPDSLYGIAEHAAQRAVDMLCGDVAGKGGITGLKKMLDVAAAFEIPGVVPPGSNALWQAAHLQVLCTVENVAYLAVAVANESQIPAIMADGSIQVPGGAGLGIEIDWQGIEARQTF